MFGCCNSPDEDGSLNCFKVAPRPPKPQEKTHAEFKVT